MGLIDRTEPFTALLFMLKMMYLHPGNRNNNRKFFAIILILGFPFFLGLFGHLMMASSDVMLSERLESLSYISQVVVYVSYGITYFHFGKELMILSQRINSGRFETKNNLSSECIRLNKITFFLYFMAAVAVLIYYIYNYFSESHCTGREILKDQRYVCGLTVPAWFPFKIEPKTAKLLLFWYFIFSMAVVPFSAVLCVIIIGFPWLMMVKIRNFRKQLKKIGDVKSAYFEVKIRYFVEYYEEIMGCMKDLNNTLGYIYTSQYALVNFTIALLGYNVLKIRNYMELGILIPWSVAQFMLCQFCQFVEDEHEKLINDFYNLPWYDLNADMRQNYRIFFARIQMPIQVRARPIAVLNSKFYLNFIRGTYSILTFFYKFTE